MAIKTIEIDEKDEFLLLTLLHVEWMKARDRTEHAVSHGDRNYQDPHLNRCSGLIMQITGD